MTAINKTSTLTRSRPVILGGVKPKTQKIVLR